jgi:hypothetical protein
MHDFWRLEDRQQRTIQTVNFSKYMALLGSALAPMATNEPWPASPSPSRESWSRCDVCSSGELQLGLRVDRVKP